MEESTDSEDFSYSGESDVESCVSGMKYSIFFSYKKKVLWIKFKFKSNIERERERERERDREIMNGQISWKT